MGHGREMLWFSRGFFSESEPPLSYNAITEIRARIQLIGYEINLLNKVCKYMYNIMNVSIFIYLGRSRLCDSRLFCLSKITVRVELR